MRLTFKRALFFLYFQEVREGSYDRLHDLPQMCWHWPESGPQRMMKVRKR